MFVRKTSSIRDALHIPCIRLQRSTWRWCAIMLVRKAGSRRTDTQSRISATNIYILKCDLFENMFERKTCSMRDAIHSPRVRTKTTTWRLFVNITGCKYFPHKIGTQSQIPDQKNFTEINLKIWLWEKPEACEMQNTSPIFESMQYHDVNLTKWSWTNLHHGWNIKGHEIRIKTISWN